MGNNQFKFNIEKIKKALNDNKHLSFEYYGASRKKEKRFIEPYKLILKENNWYLQGYCTYLEYQIIVLKKISIKIIIKC